MLVPLMCLTNKYNIGIDWVNKETTFSSLFFLHQKLCVKNA